ncbi:MAG: hypothetical protein U0350_43830 [Caldilineaceae bacterium]
MNLTIATVLACNDRGCRVQPIQGQDPVETRYSKPMVKYHIPIRPNQFVIVDNDTTPPETIFRWSRATVTKVDGNRIELDDAGQQFVAGLSSSFVGELQPGDDVVLKGFQDENRKVIDVVVNGKPAHGERLAAEWFPEMQDAAAREIE